MIRALKNGPFVAFNLLRKLEHINKKGEKQVITTWSRSSIIIPTIIGHTISIHTGNNHVSILVTDQIVGHKLGEFASTRIFCTGVKSNKKGKYLYIFYGTKS
jgi:small subunit ribosomal protein S19